MKINRHTYLLIVFLWTIIGCKKEETVTKTIYVDSENRENINLDTVAQPDTLNLSPPFTPMPENLFWSLIENVKKNKNNEINFLESQEKIRKMPDGFYVYTNDEIRLKKVLTKLSPRELISFELRNIILIEKACSFDMYHVAKLIGYVNDWHIYYDKSTIYTFFIESLIINGRDCYYQTISNPDYLAENIEYLEYILRNNKSSIFSITSGEIFIRKTKKEITEFIDLSLIRYGKCNANKLNDYNHTVWGFNDNQMDSLYSTICPKLHRIIGNRLKNKEDKLLLF